MEQFIQPGGYRPRRGVNSGQGPGLSRQHSDCAAVLSRNLLSTVGQACVAEDHFSESTHDNETSPGGDR